MRKRYRNTYGPLYGIMMMASLCYQNTLYNTLYSSSQGGKGGLSNAMNKKSPNLPNLRI